MPFHNGIEFRVYASQNTDTGEFAGRYTLTEHKGDHVLDHSARYVLEKGTEEPAKFATAEEATQAATQVAIQAIEKMTGQE